MADTAKIVYIPDNTKKKGSQKRNKKVTNTVIYVVLSLISIIWLFPFVLIVLESLRDYPTTQVSNPFFTDGVGWRFGHFESYKFLLDPTKCDFLIWYRNTFIVAAVATVVNTVFILCVAYTLSRSRFKGRKVLMNIMLVLGMFPGFLSMIVLYNVLSDMHLSQANALGGLILVSVASSGMGYHVSKGFFDTVPKALDEAARIDGANRAQVLYKIILPMAKPTVIYTILTAFMGPWGDFIFSKYLAKLSTQGYNVAAGLHSFLDTRAWSGNAYTYFCAGGVLVAIPVALLFMFLQKYYVEGVTGGAVKG